MNLISLVSHSRSRWPRWLSRLFDAGVSLVPESLAIRLNPARYGFTAAEVPAPPRVPSASTRLYIAPVNMAGQGFQWARAVEHLAGVGAVSMQYRNDGDFGFPSDNVVPVRVFRNSRRWQRRQFSAVSVGFTHVLYEAERPIFGELFDLSPEREITGLRRAGLRIGMVSHGSDLRLPSLHRELNEWSPFHDATWDSIPILERQALDHRRLLETVNAPVFVSTPDLLLDWPAGQWLPVVIDVAKWSTDSAPLYRERPLVVHAPSRAIIKGSDLIAPVMEALHEEGVVEYRRITGVPFSEMTRIYGEADVVLEQFRIGNYGVAAVESMAAGRVVIGHVTSQVRDHVMEAYGLPLPIVEATVDSLESVVRDVAARPERYRAIAAEGTVFARRIHDGTASAEVLRAFLLDG